MLATARAQQPHLQPLLMDSATFEVHQALAVPEPPPPGETGFPTLSDVEQRLYRHIRGIPKGRPSRNFYRARRWPTRFGIGTKASLDRVA